MTKPNGWTDVRWEIEGVHVFVDDRIQVCCGRGHHECCGSPDIEGDRHLVATSESENYARLIAASPSLYEALAAVLPYAAKYLDEMDSNIVKARAALAMANG